MGVDNLDLVSQRQELDVDTKTNKETRDKGEGGAGQNEANRHLNSEDSNGASS